jgi:hypothetical protein
MRPPLPFAEACSDSRSATGALLRERSRISRYCFLARENQEEDDDEDERHPEEPEQNKDHGLQNSRRGAYIGRRVR